MLAARRLYHPECSQQHSGPAHHPAVPPAAAPLRGCCAGAQTGHRWLHTVHRQAQGPGRHSRPPGQGLPQGLQPCTAQGYAAVCYTYASLQRCSRGNNSGAHAAEQCRWLTSFPACSQAALSLRLCWQAAPHYMHGLLHLVTILLLVYTLRT